MNFNDLMAKMRELDQPATEAIIQDTPVEECGEPMGMSTPSTPAVPEPSLSLNLNAQGMDNIEQLMKLMTKVNPDMINQKGPEATFPTISPEKSITSIAPLKMLPDLDSDNDDMPGGEMDIDVKGLDQDGDGDHDMGDHDMEKKDKEEAYGNSPTGASEPEYKGLDAAIPDGDDLNKPKKSFSGKAYRGDNPMAAGAYESTDLRAQIKAELAQRLEEAKAK